MGVGIEFLESSDNIFVLTYDTKWPDGNGFYDKATITFLYIKGVCIARKAVIHTYRRDDYVTLCLGWSEPKKRIEYICKFLKEGKASIEKKLRDEDEEYSIRKLPNNYDYNW